MARQIDNQQLLQSVTALTEKRDIQSLDQSLIATLLEITSASAARLCHLRDDPSEPGKRFVIYTPLAGDPNPYEPVALETEPAFSECLNNGNKLVVSNGRRAGLRIVYPVRSQSDVTGFLIIECPEEDPRDHEVISTLLTFYKNLTALLYDTQRDELTGLFNRKTFDQKVYAIASEQAADGACLAILDIDHFKRVNDDFGHLYGDEILLLFAQSMIATFRGADLLFRIGGEEFVIVLKEIDLARALLVLDRFRQRIEDKQFPQVGKITTSIGVSVILPNDYPTDIIDRADKALYYAKSNGRNQVHAYENLVAEGKLTVKKTQSDDVELF